MILELDLVYFRARNHLIVEKGIAKKKMEITIDCKVETRKITDVRSFRRKALPWKIPKA